MNRCLICFSLLFLIGCQNVSNQQNESVPMAAYVDNYILNQNSVPIYEKKQIATTDMAKNFSVDLPKRCSVDWSNQQILSVVPEQELMFVRVDKGDKLPDLEVKDFSFKNENLKLALERLLSSTNIEVVSDSLINTKITGEIRVGNLTDALELMTRLANVYYSYDAEHKLIKLSNTTKWLLKMPKDETIVLALIDAMRGSSMQNLVVNWEEKTVLFSGNSVTEKDMNKLIADLSNKKYMIAYDLDVYRIYPKTDSAISWMDILPALGTRNIKMSVPGTIGRLLVTSPEVNTKTLQEFLANKANVVLISQGTVVLPNKWQSRFDIGQCSREDRLETDLSVLFQSKYGVYADTEQNKFETKLVLQTNNGEIATYDVPSNLGDNFVVIGIPTHTFIENQYTTISPYAELAMFISPRLISIQSVNQTKTLKGMSGNQLREFLNLEVDVDSEMIPVIQKNEVKEIEVESDSKLESIPVIEEDEEVVDVQQQVDANELGFEK